MIFYNTVISSDLQNAARHQETASWSVGADSHMAAEMGKIIKVNVINYKHIYIPHSHIGKKKK